MIMILSPAKTLDMGKKYTQINLNKPQFLSEAEILIEEIRKYSPDEICEIMKVSFDIAELNHVRHLQWCKEPSDIDKQSILAFKGEAYRGLMAETMSKAELEFADGHLRILSGLYGSLKPLDGIKPFRLEMGIKLKVGRHNNLYDFWGNKIALSINEELKEHKEKFLINLASNEYYKAVREYMEYPVVGVTFKEKKGGIYKIIPVYAKRARGLMARYIIENRIDSLDKIKSFDGEDYCFSEEMSSKSNYVFLR